MKPLKHLLLFNLLLFLAVTHAQEIQSPETNYEEGVCIVRVSYQLLNLAVVDDFEEKIALKDLLNNTGREVLEKNNVSALFDLGNLEVNKLFYNLKTTDSVSVSRQGRKVTIPPFWATFKITIPTGVQIKTFIRELNRHKEIFIYAHPNYKVILDSYTNDEYYSDQHSLFSTTYSDAHIHIDSAWLMETGKPYIKVGVFDSGIDGNHEDLDV